MKKDASFHISINFLGLSLSLSPLSPECLLNFLSNFYISPYISPLPTQNSPPSSCHRALGKGRLFILPGSILSEICFLQQKGVEETMICFIKIQSKIMKMTWNIRFFIFCMIWNFFKCDRFTVL